MDAAACSAHRPFQLGQWHRLADDAGQGQAQRRQCLAGTEARPQHLCTGRQRRMCGDPVRTDHEQRAITPENIHAAIGQHRDVPLRICGKLALPQLTEVTAQRRRRQVFLIGAAGASKGGRVAHAALWRHGAQKSEARREAGLRLACGRERVTRQHNTH